MNKKKFYDSAPLFIQNTICSLIGLHICYSRYNKQFWKTLNEFENRSNWSYDQICDYQNKKLRDLVKYAYEKVPYYEEVFDERGLTPDDIQTAKDLQLLPFLNKEIVNAQPHKFLSSEMKKFKLVHSHTSGTTGFGFKFISTLDSIHAQWSCFWKQYRSFGMNFGTWRAMFGTQRIVPSKQSKPPYWRYIYPEHRLYFSGFHQSPDNLQSYYEKIKHNKIQWICMYPSLLTPLAYYMNENGLSLSGQIKLITSSAESLMEWQINAIKKAFGVKPVQAYGQMENVSIFSEQIDGRITVDEDFAITEFLPNNFGNYDIIGTNLYNYAMPLIRWQTQDTATIAQQKENMWREVLTIDGRIEDYITLPDGTKIGSITSVFKYATNMREAQIYQCKDYSLIIYIVGDHEKCRNDEKKVSSLLNESLSFQLPFSFKYVNSIARTNAGKLRCVVSEIKNYP